MQKLDLIMRFGLRFLSARFLGKKLPLLVGFSLTEQCVFNCQYCLFASNKRRNLVFSDIIKIIDMLHKSGMLVVQFTGGEPCLRNDLGDIIEYSKKKNILIMLSTSGYNIQRHKRALQYIDSIQISLDGPKHINDKVRGNGNFDVALAAADFLKSKGKQFYFRCVLNTLNIHHVNNVIAIAESYQTKAMFQLLWIPKDYKDPRIGSLIPTNSSIYATLERLADLKDKGRGVGNALFALKSFRVGLSNLPKKKSCVAGRIFFRVESNGDFLPCCRLNVSHNNPEVLNLLKTSEEDLRKYVMKSRKSSCQFCLDSSLVELNAFYNLNLSAISKIFKYFKSNE